MTTESLIENFCTLGTQMIGGKIPIKHVRDRSLKTILFTMERVSGSQAPHQALRAHMFYALECMAPMMFN